MSNQSRSELFVKEYYNKPPAEPRITRVKIKKEVFYLLIPGRTTDEQVMSFVMNYSNNFEFYGYPQEFLDCHHSNLGVKVINSIKEIEI